MATGKRAKRANYLAMSDSLPRPAPDDPHQPDEISAPIVPAPPENITQPTPTQVPATEISSGETPNAQVSATEISANESSATQVEPNATGDALDVPIDPVAQAADREGFQVFGHWLRSVFRCYRHLRERRRLGDEKHGDLRIFGQRVAFMWAAFCFILCLCQKNPKVCPAR